MVNLKQATVTLDNCVFSETEWIRLVENTAVSSNLDETEKERIKKSPVAKLLAAIPYYAECKCPDFVAVANIAVYVAAMRNPTLCNHRANQTIRQRIIPCVCCVDGNSKIIEMGLDFLELISINDHIHDYCEDVKTNHPNPLNTSSNILYYYTRKEVLIEKIVTINDPIIDEFFKIVNPITYNWWSE